MEPDFILFEFAIYYNNEDDSLFIYYNKNKHGGYSKSISRNNAYLIQEDSGKINGVEVVFFF